MDKIEIQVIQPQILQGLRAGQQDVPLPVHIVPDFGSDKQFLPFHRAFLHRIFKHPADQVLVAVYGRAVKQTVPAADRARHRAGHLFRGKVIAAEGSQTEAGDLLSVGQFPFRNQFGINKRHLAFLLI